MTNDEILIIGHVPGLLRYLRSTMLLFSSTKRRSSRSPFPARL